MNNAVTITCNDFYTWLGRKDKKAFDSLSAIAMADKRIRAKETIESRKLADKTFAKIYPWVVNLGDKIEDCLIGGRLKNCLIKTRSMVEFTDHGDQILYLRDLGPLKPSDIQKIKGLSSGVLEELYKYIERRK